MKRFIAKVSLFAFGSFLSYIVVLVVVGFYGPDYLKKNVQFHPISFGHTHSRLSEAETAGKVEVLIAGSSHAFRGYDTRIFNEHGIRAFNLGTINQTPIQTQFLLEQYVAKLKPDVVIWDVWPNTFAIDGIESLTDLLTKGGMPNQLTGLVMEANSVVAYNTYVVSQIYWNVLNLDITETGKIGMDTYVKGGFVERKLEFPKKTTPPASGRKIFREDQKIAFETALRYLNKEGVQIFLVQSPCTKRHWASFENSDEIDAFFSSFVERGLAKGYLNYNYLAASEMNDSLDFYDTHHLNQNGVEKFNKMLLQHDLVNVRERKAAAR